MASHDNRTTTQADAKPESVNVKQKTGMLDGVPLVPFKQTGLFDFAAYVQFRCIIVAALSWEPCRIRLPTQLATELTARRRSLEVLATLVP